MPEGIITVNGINLSRSGTKMDLTDTQQPYPRHYYYVRGQLPGEELLKVGATVKLQWEDNTVQGDDGKVRVYRNLTAVSPAPQPTPEAQPSAPLSSNDDRWQRRDEMSARQTACNCAAAITAAYVQVGKAAPDFWNTVEGIAAYIITGQRPESAISKADDLPEQSQEAGPTIGKSPGDLLYKDIDSFARKHNIHPAYLDKATKLYYHKAWEELTDFQKADIDARLDLYDAWVNTGRDEKGLKVALEILFDLPEPTSILALSEEKAGFLKAHYDPTTPERFVEWLNNQAKTDWSKIKAQRVA